MASLRLGDFGKPGKREAVEDKVKGRVDVLQRLYHMKSFTSWKEKLNVINDFKKQPIPLHRYIKKPDVKHFTQKLLVNFTIKGIFSTVVSVSICFHWFWFP